VHAYCGLSALLWALNDSGETRAADSVFSYSIWKTGW